MGQQTTQEHEQNTDAGGRVDPLVIRCLCPGTHGGAEKWCDKCAHNMENWGPDDDSNGVPFIDDLVCRLPAGHDGKYWSQFKPLHLHG